MARAHHVIVACLAALLVLLCGAGVRGEVLHVSAFGQPGTYDSIGGAVADAKDGDTVQIGPGYFVLSAGVVVNDTRVLSIVGSGSGTTFVSAFYLDFFLRMVHVDGGLAGQPGGPAFRIADMAIVETSASAATAVGGCVIVEGVNAVVENVMTANTQFTGLSTSAASLQLPSEFVGGAAVSVLSAPSFIGRSLDLSFCQTTNSPGGCIFIFNSSNVVLDTVSITSGAASQGGGIAIVQSSNVSVAGTLTGPLRACRRM